MARSSPTGRVQLESVKLEVSHWKFAIRRWSLNTVAARQAKAGPRTDWGRVHSAGEQLCKERTQTKGRYRGSRPTWRERKGANKGRQGNRQTNTERQRDRKPEGQIICRDRETNQIEAARPMHEKSRLEVNWIDLLWEEALSGIRFWNV